MTLRLLTEHHLEFVRLKGGCTGLFESTLVKMPHCWKSGVAAHMHTLFIGLAPFFKDQKIDVSVGITFNLICSKLKLLYDLFKK